MTTTNSSPPASRPTIGIISIGEMGLGIAKLLIAHEYRVVTSAIGRSPSTVARIESASIINLPSDEDFVQESDIIFSIVPPRDAFATAQRIRDAFDKITSSAPPATSSSSSDEANEPKPHQNPKVFLDLNAISPSSSRTIGTLFPPSPPSTGSSLPNHQLIYHDGGIIGGPPSRKPTDKTQWRVPSLPTSGPPSSSLPQLYPSLSTLLNLTHISPTIGTASGLKCCFASLTKGLTALSIMSFATASRMGVLENLQQHLTDYSPQTGDLASKGIVGMPTKAYRWVGEMREIGRCFAGEGGFEGKNVTRDDKGTNNLGNDGELVEEDEQEGNEDLLQGVEGVYNAFAEVYRFVSEGTVLGEEKVGQERKRGRTAEDVAACLVEGLEKQSSKRMRK